jgi:hypothetical protein
MHGFVFPVPFAGVLVLIATLAMIYVWLGCRCEVLGREIKTLEQEREVLHKKHLNEEYRWTRMKSLRSIENALAGFSIQMTWPANNQIVRLQDTAKKDAVNRRLTTDRMMRKNVAQGRKRDMAND